MTLLNPSIGTESYIDGDLLCVLQKPFLLNTQGIKSSTIKLVPKNDVVTNHGETVTVSPNQQNIKLSNCRSSESIFN